MAENESVQVPETALTLWAQALRALFDKDKPASPRAADNDGGGQVSASLQMWKDTQASIQSQLDSLATTIRSEVRRHNADPRHTLLFDEGDVERSVQRLYESVAPLRESVLIDGRTAGELLVYLDSDALLGAIDNNGFVSTSILVEARRALLLFAEPL